VVIRPSGAVRVYAALSPVAFLAFGVAAVSGSPASAAGIVFIAVLCIASAAFGYRTNRFAVLEFADGTLVIRGFFGSRALRRRDIGSFA
jgi:hypothetical protein